MLDERISSLHLGRLLVLAGIVLLGVLSIVGSGGGVEGCFYYLGPDCAPVVGPFPPIPAASVSPQRVTLQVGGSVTFAVESSGIDKPSYQWRRSSDGGATFIDIAGATGTTYTVAGVNLGDDATLWRADVHDSSGATVTWAAGRLAVSSMPGVVIEDGQFAVADWAVSAVAVPATNGPTHSEEQAAAGGNPGAFRSMAHMLPDGPSALQVMHTALGKAYDPATQGAIYVIDYAEDCIAPSNSTSTYLVDSRLLVEQTGRRYAAAAFSYCAGTSWSALPLQSTLEAKDFVLLDGPVCGAGESCPDFSASAAPIRFGFVRESQAKAGVAGTIVHGIDNWKVTVWRR
jgi:hypothetical protein